MWRWRGRHWPIAPPVRRDDRGAWHAVPHPLRACPYCCDRRRDACLCSGSRLYPAHWFPDTNWTVFTALAGVTYPPFPCIARPRGLPIDLSEDHLGILERLAAEAAGGPPVDWRREPFDFCLGEYGVSWVTVEELLHYDWSRRHPLVEASIGYLCRGFRRTVEEDLLPLGQPKDVRIIFGFEGHDYSQRTAHLRAAEDDVADLLDRHRAMRSSSQGARQQPILSLDDA